MGFKSKLKSFNKYNPYARRSIDGAGLLGSSSKKEEETKQPVSSSHEILAGFAANREAGEPPAAPKTQEPELYSRTRAVGPAPEFDGKNKNSAVSSGLKKGWDAFLASGNPLALAFGFASGSTVDRAYDERKTHRQGMGRYNERLNSAYMQDKAEAESLKFRQDVQTSTLNREKFEEQKKNTAADNLRGNETLAHSIVTGAMRREGGKLNSFERAALQRIYPDQVIGESVPAEIASRLLKVDAGDGASTYQVANINAPAAPAQTLRGPDGQPLKAAKAEPLVQILNSETEDAELEGEIEVQPIDPVQREAKARKLASERAAQVFGDTFTKTGEAFFSTGAGKEILDQARKDIIEQDTQRVTTERKKKVLNRRKEVKAGARSGNKARIPASEAAKRYNFQ
jgi:hypothetical protein